MYIKKIFLRKKEFFKLWKILSVCTTVHALAKKNNGNSRFHGGMEAAEQSKVA